MKSQLQRILNSDLSQYKIAVTQHLSSLDHFQQCLTERSVFMQNFNELLKQQLQRIKKDPPSEFNDTQNNSLNNKYPYNPINNKFQSNKEPEIKMKNIQIFIQRNQRLDSIPEQTSTRYNKIKVDLILPLYQYLKKTKKNVLDEIQRTKRLVLKDVNNYIVDIVDHIDAIYQNKYKQMEQTIQKLKKQNIQLKNLEVKMFNKLEQSKYEVKRSRGIGSLQNQINFNRKSQNSSINYSPIWNVQTNSNQYPHSTDRVSQERGFWYEGQKLNASKYQLSSQVRQSLKQINQMTIKNNQQVNWKHFKCNLDCTSMKQIYSNQSSSFKQNFQTFPSSQIERSICIQRQTQPNLPILLRKNNKNMDKSFDIPQVRSLVVSYPPVEQGFSILKLGNQVIYRGMWKFRRFHGKGRLTLPQYTYEGDFQYGLFHGRGNLRLGSIQFIGQFKQNRADGQGRLKTGTKSIQGIWRNNILTQKY